MATSFSGGGSRSTRREPPTMGKQLVNFITCESSGPFLAHLDKDHVSFYHHLASVVRRKLSHLNLLLRNHWANCNQTLVGWPPSNQYGRQAKNRKRGDEILIVHCCFGIRERPFNLKEGGGGGGYGFFLKKYSDSQCC